MNPLHLSVVSARDEAGSPRSGEPVTAGLPFARGLLVDPVNLTLSSDSAQPFPLQTRVLDRWSDGSVRWLLVDSRIDWNGSETVLTLTDGAGPGPDPSAPVLEVREGVDAACIDTGTIQVMLGRSGIFPFGHVTDRAGRELTVRASSGLRVTSADGRLCPIVPGRVEIEERGPVRGAVRWRGTVAGPGDDRWLELDARVECFAGLSVVRVSLTIRNPRRAMHPGNFWELGDAASALLRDASLIITPVDRAGAMPACSTGTGQPLAPWDTPFSICQESSGGDQWNGRVHVDRSGAVPMTHRGYRIAGGARQAAGLRASPVVVWGGISVAVPEFWQNFPRAIAVDGDAISIGLWPGCVPGAHELQGGEQKTHDVVIGFGRDGVSDLPLDWCRRPALLRAAPAWYCASGVVPHLVPDAADASNPCGPLVRAAIEGADTFAAKRERIDEFGWRDFGDIFADHESALRPGDPPLVSHYNNQYDAVAGFAVQFFRSGDVRWWTQMAELAAHVVDIDLYHAGTDKSAYSGGPFWHTAHYVDAGRSTHRSYPNAPGVPGGGPSCEHNYSSGLLLHHYLTGEPRSREAAAQLADWVVNIDDGTRTVFRFLDRGVTGLASATASAEYHGPGRGAANSIAALLDGYRATSRAAYLDKAEALIRRCIHPEDDIEARGLLHAEQRWSYTVFLEVLGRYLEECAERGSLGRMYAWARESLLRYARWMADREYPYLTKPELLEYPTETWAAQDVRKSDVFAYAARHAADAAERARFLERAQFFRDEAAAALSALPTRTCARPVVVLLNRGFRLSWIRAHDEAAPAPDARAAAGGFGAPETFVPQRRRALARARWIAAGGLLVAVLLAGALLLR